VPGPKKSPSAPAGTRRSFRLWMGRVTLQSAVRQISVTLPVATSAGGTGRAQACHASRFRRAACRAPRNDLSRRRQLRPQDSGQWKKCCKAAGIEGRFSSARISPEKLSRKEPATTRAIAFLQIVCPLDWKRKRKVPPGLRFADTPRNDDAVDTLFLKPI